MEEKAFGPIRFLPGKNRGKYPEAHSLLVEDAGVLIDPASDRDRLAELADSGAVNMVWLSHWHEDHMTHLDLFEDRELWIHENDALPLSDIEIFLDWYGMDQPGDDELREMWKPELFGHFHYRPRKPDRPLQGGEVIPMGDTTAEVLHTPGHTPGHLSIFFREQGVLFLGDYDLTKFGPWYGDPGSSITKTVESVNRLREIPANVWISCHGDGVFEEDPGPLWDEYLAVIDQREQKLLDYLSEPRTLDDVIGQWIVYRKAREPLSFFRFTERAMIGKHLEKLLDEKTIVLEDGFYRRP
ncbi:MAG: MBL fold metallo-hydrolase [Desulfatibacillaceae bacterium]